ncbi:unnamed protein product [Pleuronectes platessa]|uniref:Uncharacterized protein n=1 Tax=Pleuronectes platessa TaxID=8262 RepID=A0A9N7YW26_PLEPL|nr:unnamed protein product [Pleuronectes platessa]
MEVLIHNGLLMLLEATYSPINPPPICLDCGRKPEYPEKTNPRTGRNMQTGTGNLPPVTVLTTTPPDSNGIA